MRPLCVTLVPRGEGRGLAHAIEMAAPLQPACGADEQGHGVRLGDWIEIPAAMGSIDGEAGSAGAISLGRLDGFGLSPLSGLGRAGWLVPQASMCCRARCRPTSTHCAS